MEYEARAEMTVNQRPVKYVWSRCCIFIPIMAVWPLIFGLVWAKIPSDQSEMSSRTLFVTEDRPVDRILMPWEERLHRRSVWQTAVDTASRHVPAVDSYVRSRYLLDMLRAGKNDDVPAVNTNCTATLTAWLTSLTSGLTSDPMDVQRWLSALLLDDSEPARRAIAPLLTEGQNLTELVHMVSTCAANNPPLAGYACAAVSNPSQLLPTFGDVLDQTLLAQRATAKDILTYMLVLDRLAITAVSDVTFADDLLYHISSRVVAAGSFAHFPAGVRAEIEDVYKRTQLSLAEHNRLRRVGSGAITTRVQRAAEVALQLLLLEDVDADSSSMASDADIFHTHVGLRIAHYVSARGQRLRLYESAENIELLWPIGKGWTDALIAHSVAHAAGARGGTSSTGAGVLATLGIPSVICSTASPATSAPELPSGDLNGGRFIVPRTISLFLHVASLASPSRPQQPLTISPATWAAFGTSNLAYAYLRVPSKSELLYMLNELPIAVLSIFNYVSTDQWLSIVTISTYGSVLVWGWGSEVVCLQYLMNFVGMPGRVYVGLWVYAQLAFPLFLSIAVFSRSYFGLPFLVLGLWKFGCAWHAHAPFLPPGMKHDYKSLLLL